MIRDPARTRLRSASSTGYTDTDKNEIWRQILLCGPPSCMEQSNDGNLCSCMTACIRLSAETLNHTQSMNRKRRLKTHCLLY